MFQRVLVHPVVAEGREAEQHPDALGVGVVDQVPNEVLADVLVLLVVLPGDRELLGPERPAHPEQKQIAAVVVDAVHDLLPGGQVVGRHPHEGDVVAPFLERAFVLGRRRSGEEQGGNWADHLDTAFLRYFIGCFWKNSHIRSLAEMSLVDFPMRGG